MLKGPPVIVFTDIMCDPLAEGGRGAGLGAPEGRPHIPEERNFLMSCSFLAFLGGLQVFLKAVSQGTAGLGLTF